MLFEPLQEVLLTLRVEMENLRLASNCRHPAVALPEEILAIIFEEACEVTPGVPRTYVDRLTRTDIVGTCSRWRRVGIATTVLWNNISMRLSPGKEGPVVFPPQVLLELEVHRSLRCPVRVSVSFEDYIEWHDSADLLESLGHRCGLLIAGCSKGASWGTSSPLATLLGDISSDLRTFTLSLSKGNDIHQPTEAVDLTKTSAVESFRLQYRPTYSADIRFLHFLHPSVWPVRRLSLVGLIDLSTVIGAINACHGLELLEWHCDYPPDGIAELEEMMNAIQPQLSLDSLSLEGKIPLLCLRYLSSPNLMRLRAAFEFDAPSQWFDDPWSASNHPFIQASQFPELRYLEIMENDVLPVSFVAPFFRAHPALEVLTLCGFSLDEEFVDALGASVSKPILPNLRDLWVEEADPEIVPALLRLQTPPFVLHAPSVRGPDKDRKRPSKPISEGQNKLMVDSYADEVDIWTWW